jgi:hypothetical protein
MALGERGEQQQEMWVATRTLPKSVEHVFYQKLKRLLTEADCLAHLELCAIGA